MVIIKICLKKCQYKDDDQSSDIEEIEEKYEKRVGHHEKITEHQSKAGNIVTNTQDNVTDSVAEATIGIDEVIYGRNKDPKKENELTGKPEDTDEEIDRGDEDTEEGTLLIGIEDSAYDVTKVEDEEMKI